MPLAEEMFFRGLLFGWLRSRTGFAGAALASAAPFAAAHLFNSAENAVFTFLLGLVLAWSYEEVRSLWAPVYIHRTVNGVGLKLIYLAT